MDNPGDVKKFICIKVKKRFDMYPGYDRMSLERKKIYD